MKKILWVGGPFFSNKLADYGWEQISVQTFSEFRLFTFEELVQKAGFTPDVLVVADKSMPPFVVGVEKFPCLTVLYVVDSHLHSWYPFYAQGFDFCLVSLHDHIPLFLKGVLSLDRILWSPPYSQDDFRPGTPVEPEWEAIFVGTISDNTPLRKIFFDRLREILPCLHVTRGNFVSLFPKAKVVVNFCEHGDLNFRVFEAMGMASALVTPKIGNRQEALFTNNRHFLLYDKDPAEAKERIETLLHDDQKRKTMQANALAAIDAKHRASHRARALTDLIASFWDKKDELIAKRLKNADLIRATFLKILYLLWAKEIDVESVQARYLEFAKR